MKELKSYLNKNTKNNFAIEVNGKWGSGKTYFVTSFIEENEDEFNHFRRVIYISLNGVRKYSEIQDQIIASMLGQDKKAGRVIYGLVRTAASLFIKNIDNYSGDENDIKVNVNDVIPLEKILFIFDDLERIGSTLKINNLLGYIHRSYLRNDTNKAIYLCDESNIENIELFKKHKEKYIGWTLSFRQTNETVVKSILAKYNFYDDSNRHATEIICRAVLFDNYRSLIFALDTFTAINHLLPKNKYAYNSYLMSVLIIAKEFKRGTIDTTKSKIEFPPSLDWRKRRKLKGDEMEIATHEMNLYLKNSFMDSNDIQATLILESYFVRLVTSFKYNKNTIKNQLLSTATNIANRFDSKIYATIKSLEPFWLVETSLYKDRASKLLDGLKKNKYDVFDTMEIIIHFNSVLGYNQKYLPIDFTEIKSVINSIEKDSYILHAKKDEFRFYKYPLRDFLEGTHRFSTRLGNKFIDYFKDYQQVPSDEVDLKKKSKAIYNKIIKDDTDKSFNILNELQHDIVMFLFLEYSNDFKFNRILLKNLLLIQNDFEAGSYSQPNYGLINVIHKPISTFYKNGDNSIKHNELFVKDKIVEIISQFK